MPAKTGAETEVPPMIEKLVSTAVAIPSAQLLPVLVTVFSVNSCVQKI
jgi:hypothetical protein